MGKYSAKETAQKTNSPDKAERHRAGKDAAEKALEELLGANGDEMVARARIFRAILEKLEKGEGDGGTADAQDRES